MAFDLQQAVRDAKPNETIRVPAGRYPVNLVLTRPVTLLAAGQVVLDGTHRGSVVRVECPGGTIKLVGLAIVGGTADEAGGGVCVLEGDVEMLQCVVRFNKAPQFGGGGLYAGGGKVLAQQCRFEANTGRQGGGVLVDGVATCVLRDSTIIQNAAVEGGGVRVKEGASAELVSCTIADNKVVGDNATGGALHVSGTSTRAPTVKVTQSIVSERTKGPACVFNSEKTPGTVTFTKNLLPPWCASIGGDNVFAEAGFTMSGAEPYLLGEKSPAIGAGDRSVIGDAKDVMGKARKTPDLGAFAAGSTSALPY